MASRRASVGSSMFYFTTSKDKLFIQKTIQLFKTEFWSQVIPNQVKFCIKISNIFACLFFFKKKNSVFLFTCLHGDNFFKKIILVHISLLVLECHFITLLFGGIRFRILWRIDSLGINILYLIISFVTFPFGFLHSVQLSFFFC